MYCYDTLKKSHAKFLCGFLVLCEFCFFQPVWGQTAADSVDARPVSKSTRVAMLRSALIPGWGQWYNGQHLKSFLVLGIEAGLATGAVVQNQRFVDARNTYGPGDESTLFYEDSRSQFLWYLGAAHLLNILDAFIDAYLADFDTGESLAFVPMMGQPQSVGLTLSIRFP